MSVKDDRFIFTKEHRRLTYLGGLAITPLFLTVVATVLIWLTTVELAELFIELLISAGYELQILLWLVLPFISVVLSRRGLRYGTRRYLRKWNLFLFWLALVLLAGLALLVGILNIL